MSCLELTLSAAAPVKPMNEVWQKRLDRVLEAGRDQTANLKLMLVDGRALAEVRDGVNGLASAALALLIGRTDENAPTDRAAVKRLMVEAARLGLDPMLIENFSQDQLRELVVVPGRGPVDGILFIGRQPDGLARTL